MVETVRLLVLRRRRAKHWRASCIRQARGLAGCPRRDEAAGAARRSRFDDRKARGSDAGDTKDAKEADEPRRRFRSSKAFSHLTRLRLSLPLPLPPRLRLRLHQRRRRSSASSSPSIASSALTESPRCQSPADPVFLCKAAAPVGCLFPLPFPSLSLPPHQQSALRPLRACDSHPFAMVALNQTWRRALIFVACVLVVFTFTLFYFPVPIPERIQSAWYVPLFFSSLFPVSCSTKPLAYHKLTATYHL